VDTAEPGWPDGSLTDPAKAAEPVRQEQLTLL
jgi:hypothetical protein